MSSTGVFVVLIILLLIVIGVVIWAIVYVNQSGNGKNSRKCTSSYFCSSSLSTGAICCSSDTSRGCCPSSPDCSISSSSSSSCESSCKKQLAQFSEFGAQSIAIGQPLVLTSDSITSTDGIVKTDGVLTNLSSSTGSVFMIEKKGYYTIAFQLPTTTLDVGLAVALGETALTLVQLDYTVTGVTYGSVLVHVPHNGMVLAVIAASGNSTAITVPALTSTSNTSVATVSITKYK